MHGTYFGGTVWIIVLNWNNADDTVACIDSLMRLTDQDWRLAVCDNASVDGSATRLATALQARYGSAFADVTEAEITDAFGNDARVILIRNADNHGYAGGNNVGLRLALHDPRMRAAWILNNDTEVEPDSLRALRAHATDHPEQGIIGATLVYHHDPDRIQAAGGGTYHRWTGLCDHHGYGLARSAAASQARRPLDYVFGAAMFIRREWLEQVGLMDDSLFLYFEEIDYCRAGRGRFAIGYCPAAFVRHKEGGTTGGKRHDISRLADFYNLRNRLRITWRHFPLAIPTVWFGLIITIFNRMRRRQWDRVWMVLRIAARFRTINYEDVAVRSD